jgi:hypothetical protein
MVCGSEICFEGYFPPLKRRRKWDCINCAAYIHKESTAVAAKFRIVIHNQAFTSKLARESLRLLREGGDDQELAGGQELR